MKSDSVLLSLLQYTEQILAALLAPFFMSLGFFIWDHRWTSSGASAFALNSELCMINVYFCAHLVYKIRLLFFTNTLSAYTFHLNIIVYKCNVASIGFIIMCLIRGFEISSSDIEESVFTTQSVGMLILSSTLGIIIGDVLWLEALRLLGAKHVIVIDSLKPFIAAILGRLALDEVLKPPAWGGMILTVVGIGIVAWEEQRQRSSSAQKDDTDNNDREKPIEQTEATDRLVFDNEEEVNRTNIENIEEHINSNSNQQIPIEDTADNNTNTNGKRIIHFSRESSVYRRGYICAIINVLADSLGSLLTSRSTSLGLDLPV